MNFNNAEEFIDYYQLFLHINALLYHPATCPYTEPTPLYEELIQDLLLHIDLLTEEEKAQVETNHQSDGTIQHMQKVLLQQLDRLEKPYDLQAPAW